MDLADLNAWDARVSCREALNLLWMGRTCEALGVKDARRNAQIHAASVLHRATSRMAQREGIETAGWAL